MWRKHCKFLRKLYIIAVEPRVRRFKKLPEYRLKKNKFTLSSFETSHPSIVLAFRTLFMLSTKAKFTLLFQKIYKKHNVRSYFEVTRVLAVVLVYIYTKNVTPGNKTLGSHLKLPITEFTGLNQYTLSIITSQLHCFQIRTILNGKDFKFFSHGLCTEKQNILLQHMRKKHFWILINEYGNKHKHENEAPGHDLEPRFRVKAYFHVYWSK